MVIEQYQAISNAVSRPLASWWQRIGVYILTIGLCSVAIRVYWFWFYNHEYADYLFGPRATDFPMGMYKWQWDDFEILLAHVSQLAAIAMWLLPAAVVIKYAASLSQNLPHPHWSDFRRGLYLKLLGLGALPFALGLLVSLTPMVVIAGERNPIYFIQVLVHCLENFMGVLLVVFQPMIFLLAFAVLTMQRLILFWLWACSLCLGQPLLIVLVCSVSLALSDESRLVTGMLVWPHWFSSNYYVGYNWEIGGFLVITMLLLLAWGRHRAAVWLWVPCFISATFHALEPLLYDLMYPVGNNPGIIRSMLVVLGPARFMTSKLARYDEPYLGGGGPTLVLDQPVFLVKSGIAADSLMYVSWLINLGWLALCIGLVMLVFGVPVRAQRD